MNKEKWTEKLLIVFLDFLAWIGLLERRAVSKESMCESAINGGVCPKYCETCIWSVSDER